MAQPEAGPLTSSGPPRPRPASGRAGRAELPPSCFRPGGESGAGGRGARAGLRCVGKGEAARSVPGLRCCPAAAAAAQGPTAESWDRLVFEPAGPGARPGPGPVKAAPLSARWESKPLRSVVEQKTIIQRSSEIVTGSLIIPG